MLEFIVALVPMTPIILLGSKLSIYSIIGSITLRIIMFFCSHIFFIKSTDAEEALLQAIIIALHFLSIKKSIIFNENF